MKMSGARGERRPVSDTVAEHIQSAILDGEFQAGDRLPPERELAERLDVNRSSVREALKKLQQLRLIDIQQGSGIRVRDLEDASFDLVGSLVFRAGVPDRRWIQGLLELREAVMPGILRLAMSRSTTAELEAAAREARASADPALSDGEFVAGLGSLQGLLAGLTRNPVLVLLSNALGRLTSRWLAAPIPAIKSGCGRSLSLRPSCCC